MRIHSIQESRSPRDGSALRALVWLATASLVAGWSGAAHAQSTWDPVEIGTVGGASSTPSDINNLGQVVGTSATTSSPSHAFLVRGGTSAVDLGTLGGLQSWASDVNESTDVVGQSDTFTGERHAFLWSVDRRGMVDLGTLGGARSAADAINEAGAIAGSATTSGGVTHAFLWTPASGMRDLGTLGGRDSRASAINDAGHVVGTSDTTSGAAHAFIWTPAAGMIDLGTLGGSASEAVTINDSGRVAGTSETSSGDRHAFLWAPDIGMRDLGTLGGHSSQATDINGAGQVVGWSHARDGSTHAFLWPAPSPCCLPPLSFPPMLDLQGFDGPIWSAGYDVNENGQVVGESEAGAFVWSQTTGLILLSGIGGNPRAAVRLNDVGQAVGFEIRPGGIDRTLIWCTRVAPTILGAWVSPSVLSPATNRLVNVHVNYLLETRCENAITTTLSVLSDEPNDPPNGDGFDDAIVIDDHNVMLRAERLSSGDGRTYTIRIRVESQGLESTADVTVAVPNNPGDDPMTGVVLTTNGESPQPIGKAIVLGAVGQGGEGPYAYRFWAQPWGTGAWQVIQDWSSSSTYLWRPADPGGYNVAVEARRASLTDGSEVRAAIGFEITAAPTDGGPMTSVTLATKVPSPQAVGTTVVLEATGHGGLGPYAYRFWIQAWGGHWQVVQDWSLAFTHTWRPMAFGGYNLAVEARRSGVGATEVQTAINFWVDAVPMP